MSELTVTDMFCGAGGSSQGAVAAGLRLELALNHWDLAIATHSANFPDAAHDCADVSQTDPRRYWPTDILLASPECKEHSEANGRASAGGHPRLFETRNDYDRADRSRATMWDVGRFAEVHHYRRIVVENVSRVRDWVGWEAWLHYMHSLGYTWKILYLNSLVAHPTPQSRDRIYVVLWPKGDVAPDLEVRPAAWCGGCNTEVAAVQSWRNPRKPWGKLGQQYDYRCPHCAHVAAPLAWPAWTALDLDSPGQRIGSRRKPLSATTLARIELGLRRFGPAPTLVESCYTQDHTRPPRPVGEPFPAQTGRQSLGLTTPQPFLVDLRGTLKEHPGGTHRGVDEPLSTMVAEGTHHMLVHPPDAQPPRGWVVANYGNGTDPHKNGWVRPVSDVLGTVTTVDHHALLVPSGGTWADNPQPITRPFPSQTASESWGLASLPRHFLVKYNRTGGPRDPHRPLDTLTGKDRYGLVLVDGRRLRLEDCQYRMLTVDEIRRAMAFADGYLLHGSKRDRVAQLGNAVTPPVMRLLTSRVVESLR